ncbi:AGXT2 [Bugula neritina]|uniref:Alanine--glyoxylate aminotransferase 2, mitochondrial n=1 Tax=Bugula neritina TaxID=10212 RepID=A0A7J7JP51_BUGNE|nr:AGXT2 [Bugula neritina]
MDEVQTGFGRTGDNFWGFQGHDVVPDIAVMAKGIANGFPMAAVVTTKEIASVMDSAIHFNTFGGNPVGCAMASTVLDVIEDEKLQENARELGSYYLMGLAKLRDQYEIVGDVRGKGFMMGIELVTDKDSKTALPKEQTLDILDDLKNMRLLCGKGGVAGNILRIQPPLVTTKADVDYALGCFDLAFANHRDRQSKQEAQFGEERKAHASM